MERIEKNKSKVLLVMKCLLCAYIITGSFLLILAFLLYKFDLDNGKVTVGILFIYILSSFTGGFLLGKVVSEKKFMWGALFGTLYFGTLFVLSIVVNRSVSQDISTILTSFILCAGAGMIGGMIS